MQNFNSQRNYFKKPVRYAISGQAFSIGFQQAAAEAGTISENRNTLKALRA
jgi:hypothetical protein